MYIISTLVTLLSVILGKLPTLLNLNLFTCNMGLTVPIP